MGGTDANRAEAVSIPSRSRSYQALAVEANLAGLAAETNLAGLAAAEAPRAGRARGPRGDAAISSAQRPCRSHATVLGAKVPLLSRPALPWLWCDWCEHIEPASRVHSVTYRPNGEVKASFSDPRASARKNAARHRPDGRRLGDRAGHPWSHAWTFFMVQGSRWGRVRRASASASSTNRSARGFQRSFRPSIMAMFPIWATVIVRCPTSAGA